VESYNAEMVFHSELEASAGILLNHLRYMAEGLRKLPEDKWDWTFAPPAPTARILAVHTLQWLQCDRQHINNPEARTFQLLPEAPADTSALCDALEAEADACEVMLQRLTPEDLDRSGMQFGDPRAAMNVRGFINHMVQNTIYKHGQFSTIFFGLGLDGDGPYQAPFPNEIYKELTTGRA
jgi:uncharacterized damage-inducible protein DinB